MTSDAQELATLPHLSSPQLSRLRGRLEDGLLRLAELIAMQNAAEQIGVGQNVSNKSTLPAEDGDRPSHVPKASAERRAFPRRASHCRVAICRLLEDEDYLTPQQIEWRLHASTLKGDLCDLSLSGAAILLHHPLTEGENVVLRLSCPRRDHHLDHQAEVVRSLPDESGSGEYKVVCQFPERLTLDQVSFYSRLLNQSGLI